jgi:hypothetical protein
MDTEDLLGVLDRKGFVMLIDKDGEEHLLAVKLVALQLMLGFEEPPTPICPLGCMVVVIDTRHDCMHVITVCDPDALQALELNSLAVDQERSGYAATQSAKSDDLLEALAVTVG